MVFKRAEARKKMRARKRKGLGPSAAVKKFVEQSKNPALKAAAVRAKELRRLNRGGLIGANTAKLLLGSKGRQKAGRVGDIKKLKVREAVRIRKAKGLGISVPQMLKQQRK